jgi:hypothetical protein
MSWSDMCFWFNCFTAYGQHVCVVLNTSPATGVSLQVPLNAIVREQYGVHGITCILLRMHLQQGTTDLEVRCNPVQISYIQRQVPQLYSPVGGIIVME